MAGLFIFVSCIPHATPSTAKRWSRYFVPSLHCLRASRRPSPQQYCPPPFALQKPNHEAIVRKRAVLALPFVPSNSSQIFKPVVSCLDYSKMEQNPGKNPTILEAAETCEQLFTHSYDTSNKAVADHDPQSNEGWPHLIANQHGRFRVWAENIGVFAGGKASLDYRLRDSPTVAGLMLDQLSNLHAHLENIKILLGGDDNTQAADEARALESAVSDTSPDSESEQSASVLDEPVDIRAARQSIDRLNRLSLTIRRQSVIQRNSRAAFYEEEDENKVEKVSAFNIMAQHMVNIWYPDASEIIRHRLAETMVIRRRQLLYRRSHQQKLKGHDGRQSRPKRNQLAPQTSTGIHRHSSSSHYGSHNAPTQPRKSAPNSKAESHGKHTATQASTLKETGFNADAVSSIASTALSAAASDFECLELPKPPKPIQGHSEFTCPYCYMVVPLKEADGKNWKCVSLFFLHSTNLLTSVQAPSHERSRTLHLLVRKLYRTSTTVSRQKFLVEPHAQPCCQMGMRPTNAQTADLRLRRTLRPAHAIRSYRRLPASATRDPQTKKSTTVYPTI